MWNGLQVCEQECVINLKKKVELKVWLNGGGWKLHVEDVISAPVKQS